MAGQNVTIECSLINFKMMIIFLKLCKAAIKFFTLLK